MVVESRYRHGDEVECLVVGKFVVLVDRIFTFQFNDSVSWVELV